MEGLAGLREWACIPPLPFSNASNSHSPGSWFWSRLPSTTLAATQQQQQPVPSRARWEDGSRGPAGSEIQAGNAVRPPAATVRHRAISWERPPLILQPGALADFPVFSRLCPFGATGHKHHSRTNTTNNKHNINNSATD